MTCPRGICIAATVSLLPLILQTAGGTVPEDPEEVTLRPRISLGGGMGVSYVNPYDVANYVSALTLNRAADFTAAVEFFGSAALPVSQRWLLALEYAYLLGGYSGVGSAEFTFRVHMPTLIVQYALVEEERYNVRVGAGLGYHTGTLSVRYVTLDDEFTGAGPAMKIDCEANTALGDNLFARLGVDARWDFIGDLRNAAGQGLLAPIQTEAPTLHFFSVGAKLGATWYF